MVDLNLQFFGGRGSGGGRNGGGGGGSASEATSIPAEEWDDWSLDPSLYQRAEKGIDISEELDEMGIYESDYDRIMATSRKMQKEALSQTVGQKTLYRGEEYSSLAQAQSRYQVGKTIETSQLTSYADNEALAKSYATQTGKGVSVVISNTSTAGDFVGVRANHTGSAKRKDPEVIVARGQQSTVTSARYDKKTKTLYVTMENSAKPRKK